MVARRFISAPGADALYRTSIPDDQASAMLYDGYRPIQPENIAQIVGDVIALPVHVDIARIEVFPTDQARGGGTMVTFGAR